MKKYNTIITVDNTDFISQVTAKNKADAIRKSITIASKKEKWNEDAEDINIFIVELIAKQIKLVEAL